MKASVFFYKSTLVFIFAETGQIYI